VSGAPACEGVEIGVALHVAPGHGRPGTDSTQIADIAHAAAGPARAGSAEPSSSPTPCSCCRRQLLLAGRPLTAQGPARHARQPRRPAAGPWPGHPAPHPVLVRRGLPRRRGRDHPRRGLILFYAISVFVTFLVSLPAMGASPDGQGLPTRTWRSSRCRARASRPREGTTPDPHAQPIAQPRDSFTARGVAGRLVLKQDLEAGTGRAEGALEATDARTPLDACAASARSGRLRCNRTRPCPLVRVATAGVSQTDHPYPRGTRPGRLTG
jgi:hypothetical protein